MVLQPVPESTQTRHSCTAVINGLVAVGQKTHEGNKDRMQILQGAARDRWEHHRIRHSFSVVPYSGPMFRCYRRPSFLL